MKHDFKFHPVLALTFKFSFLILPNWHEVEKQRLKKMLKGKPSKKRIL